MSSDDSTLHLGYWSSGLLSKLVFEKKTTLQKLELFLTSNGKTWS